MTNNNFSSVNVNVMTELEITKASLAVGWVKFSYYKADGTKRVAVGTTNRALIDQVRGYKMSEHRENKTYYENCGYFDLSRGDWRQFRKERFIGLELARLDNEHAVTIALTIAYGLEDTTPTDFERIRSCSASLVGLLMVDTICHSIQEEFDFDADPSEEFERVVVKVHDFVTPKCFLPKGKAEPKSDREELIAELMELRKRESEILAELLK